MADVVSALRRESPSASVLLSGHSMGGGVALRYAARRHQPGVDGYLLFAPHLGANSPVERTRSAGDAGGAEPVLKVHVPRLVGLVLLNMVGIGGLNGLDTLFFNVGHGFPIHTYTFRATATIGPDGHLAALTADKKPLLVVAGPDDEAFQASEYPAVIARHRNGKAIVIPAETHDGITRSRPAFVAIEEWIRGFHKST